MPFHRALATSSLLVTLTLAACATPPPPPRPKAKPAGAGVVVTEPVVRVASGTACGEEITNGIGARFRSATVGALSRGGFKVTDKEDAPYQAGVEIEVDYCSEAGIVSGSTALELKRGGNSVWRGQATGDQARGETAQSTLAELVEQMLYDPNVIDVTK